MDAFTPVVFVRLGLAVLFLSLAGAFGAAVLFKGSGRLSRSFRYYSLILIPSFLAIFVLSWLMTYLLQR